MNRLELRINEGCNGDAEMMRNMMEQTVERLRQLGGEIPHCVRPRVERDIPRRAMHRNHWYAYGDDGMLDFHSYGRGMPDAPEAGDVPDLECEIAEYDALTERACEREDEAMAHEITGILRGTRGALAHEEHYVRTADALWERTPEPEEPRPFRSERKKTADSTHPDFGGDFSPGKSAAYYALTQLGWE